MDKLNESTSYLPNATLGKPVFRGFLPSGKKARGQISIEYVMILAAMLLILTLLIIIFNGIYTQQTQRSQYLQADNALHVLSASAQEVWVEGNGSSQLVNVDLPPTTVLSSSNFSDRTMFLYLMGFGDVSISVPFPINGTWPSSFGRSLMSLYNNGTTVLIRPGGRLEANLTGFYFLYSTGGNQVQSLGLRNRANVTYSVTHTLVCPNSLTCGYNATNGFPYMLAPEANQTANLQLSGGSPGLYTSYLTLDLVPSSGSGLPTEQYILPITVRVTG